MKKALNLAGLLLAATLILGGATGRIYARLTGTDPGTDVFCIGPSALEVCVDVSGNFLPTTNSVGTLGTSALRFNNAYLTSANVSGTAALTTVTATTLTNTSTITTTGASLSVSSNASTGFVFNFKGVYSSAQELTLSGKSGDVILNTTVGSICVATGTVSTNGSYVYPSTSATSSLRACQ